MNKIYKLLIDSPEYPKDSYVQWNDYHDGYEAYYANGKNIYNGSHAILFSAEQIENRPEVWELVEDKLDLRSPEAEKMREESRATRFEFVPKNGEVAYYYDHVRRLVLAINYSGGFLMDWHNGFIKRTERECKAHAEKYARYFLTE